MTTTRPLVERFTFATGTDPLGRDVPIEHLRALDLYGVPLIIESNAELMLEIVEGLFGAPQAGSAGPSAIRDSAQTPERPMRFRIVVEPNRWGDASVPIYWRYPDDDHALLVGPGLVTSLDLAAGTGAMFVEEQMVREGGRDYFAHAIAEGPILMLPTQRDRHPIHAAALRRGDRGLILHGPSGAGKSTLCYVASRAGIDILADDAIRVQRVPTLRVWGGGGAGRRAGHIHVREDVRERFAELRENHGLGLRTTGVLKYVVSLPVVDAQTSHPPYVSRVRVCLLDRERGPMRCERVSANEIAQTIVSAPESRADRHEAGRRPAADAIATGGGWRLRLSNDPEEALPFLIDMLDQI
jgi:hypothetical protein